MPITVRPLTTLEECTHFQRVEHMIWGSDDESVVPTHVLITLLHNGGLVMGAFADDGPPQTGGMVGIVMGFLGAAEPPWVALGHDPGPDPGRTPRLKFCSHMAGVLPAWQRQRVGLQLKLAQYDWVRAQGLTDWMTWTYDPLYRANGVFNIHRLGAVCRTYIRDLYGEMTDALNAGSPSDRCQVDWWLESARVRAAVARASASEPPPPGAALPARERFPGLRVLSTRAAGAFRAPAEPDPAPVLDGAPLALPIPEDIAAIRRQDQPLGLAWRFFVRSGLEQAFAAGYSMVDCTQVEGDEWCYILTCEV